jgi:hypothetical protein
MAEHRVAEPSVPTLTRVYASVTHESRAAWEASREYWRKVPDAPKWLLESFDDRAYDDYLDVSVSLAAEDDSGRRIEGGDFGVGGPRRGSAARWKSHAGPPPPEPPLPFRLLQELLYDWRDRRYRVGRRDIEDSINQMLGRDPEQHRPPRLVWHGLVDALADAGIDVTEDELIALPLTVELDAELEAELAA